MDVSVNVIKNEFIRCVAAKSLDFAAFKDIDQFWALQNPGTDSSEYEEYAIAEHNPALLGSEMYAPREDVREELTMSIQPLSMATRYSDIALKEECSNSKDQRC